jgi:hypothetical protein
VKYLHVTHKGQTLQDGLNVGFANGLRLVVWHEQPHRTFYLRFRSPRAWSWRTLRSPVDFFRGSKFF